MSVAGRPVLTFEAGGEALAIAADEVDEIVLTPRITRVPQSPPALRGLASLRGNVVPILSVEALLCGVATKGSDHVIVLRGADPVGLAVERVGAILVEGDGPQSEAGVARPAVTGPRSPRVLERADLLGALFAGRHAGPPAVAREIAPVAPDAGIEPGSERDDVAFLQFDLAGQAYALPLEQVLSVLQAPTRPTALPHTDAMMLGVVEVRDVLVPLISMRALLGLPARALTTSDRVVVARLGEAVLGLVVDHIQAILRTRESQIGTVPGILNRGAGEARIDAIIRTPAGLVSVLPTERIFIEDTVAQIIAEAGGSAAVDAGPQEIGSAVEPFVLFRLNSEAYGAPVAAVQEVLRLPEALTRVPFAPDFVVGLMNHRGAVVPLIDLRRRFNAPGRALGREQRVILVRLDDLMAGFIADAVEEVLKAPVEDLRATPDIAAADGPLFDRIATRDRQGRLVLLIDPRELLDQTERDILHDVVRRMGGMPT